MSFFLPQFSVWAKEASFSFTSFSEEVPSFRLEQVHCFRKPITVYNCLPISLKFSWAGDVLGSCLIKLSDNDSLSLSPSLPPSTEKA